MRGRLEDLKFYAIAYLFIALVTFHALFGCATAKTIASSCVPSVADVTTAWTDAQSEGYVAALTAFVASKGLCLVQAAVDQAIQQHTVAAETTLAAGGKTGDSEYAAIARLQLWRAQHP